MYIRNADGSVTFSPYLAGNPVPGSQPIKIQQFTQSATVNGRTFSAADLNYATALVYAEAGNDPVDQYAVASVLWNRIGATGISGGVAWTFTDVGNAPNQFTAITGSRFTQALAGTPQYPGVYNSAYNQMQALLGDQYGPGATYNYNQFVSYSKPGYTQLVTGGNYYYNNPGIKPPKG